MIKLLRRIAVLFALLLAAPGVAFAGQYVPIQPGDVSAADRAVVAKPAPVQLLFQFKTNGVPNYAATQFLVNQVTDQVRASGAFSEITSGPAAGGAVLSVTIENIPEEGAFRQGFATGATFGLAGNSVIDHYLCTFEYVAGPGAPVVSKVIKHQIITTVGIKKQPLGTIAVKNVEEAVYLMARRVVDNGVNDVAKDPGFAPGGAPTAPVVQPELTPRFAIIRRVAGSDLAPIKLGTFERGPKLPAGKDKAMGVRLMKAEAPGGSFAGFLRATLETDLGAAGKLDAASGLELTGVLLESELQTGGDPASASIAARFVLKRDGVVVFDKEIRADDRWKAAFVGAVAIPDAINRYYTLYQSLSATLLQDPEFIAAAKAPTPGA